MWYTKTTVATGQSIVTDRAWVAVQCASPKDFGYASGGSVSALASWFRSVFFLSVHTALRRLDTLYLVCSRSNIGFVRDLPAYFVGRLGVRVIVHVHGSDVVDLVRRPLIGSVALWCMRGVRVIVPSSHLLEPLARAGLTDCHICENFVEHVPAPALPSGHPADACYSVLWNSNVMASKGFFETAEAVIALHREGLPIRLVSLGAPLGDETMSLGECSARLQSLLASAACIDYRGRQNRIAAMEALMAADVVCLPSRYVSECQPLALLEAMCAGKPLIAADTEALRATVQNYPCIFLGEVTADSIAQALKRVVLALDGDDGIRLCAARQHAQSRFSVDRFDERLRQLLGLPSPEVASGGCN